jgi:hypothetical protein
MRQVAIAVASGSEAIENLRSTPIAHSNLDRLDEMSFG